MDMKNFQDNQINILTSLTKEFYKFNHKVFF